MYYVYALQTLKDKNWLYVGYTTNLKERFTKHTKGEAISTKKYLPLRLVYYEAYLNKTDAAKREYELKHNSQQKEILKDKIKYSLA